MLDRSELAFALRMAWRELRAAWLRLAFFFVCVSIGVAAIIAIRSVIQNVRQVMTREARNLIASDLIVESNRPLTSQQEASLEREVRLRGLRPRSTLIQTLTMMRPEEGVGVQTARMAEVRGVDAAYPLYGTLTLASGRPYSHDLLADHGAIVQPDVLAQLGLTVGDKVILAGTPFTIRDVLVKESAQRRGGVTFGPRIYIDLDTLRRLPIFGPGGRMAYAWMFNVDERRLLRAEGELNVVFAKSSVSVTTWRRLEDRIGDALAVGENYLSLIGFAMVVLGGIGVWSVTRVFVQQKLKTIAVMKCLGATSQQTLWTYVLQITGLTLAGCVLGAGLAAAALAAIPASTLAALRVDAVHITVSAVAQGSAVGVLVSMLFAAVPLLDVRQVKPLLLMRADTAPTARRRDWRSWATFAGLGVSIAAVAVWQAGSLKAGAIVMAGLAITAGVLHVTAHLMVRAVRPLARSRRFALRHAVISLSRAGGQARIVLMAVGLGAFFVIGMRVVQDNLLHEFSPESGSTSPDLVLIDVQTDQVDGIRAIASKYTGTPPAFVPLMRARVTGVDGHHLQLKTIRDVQEHGQGLAREFGLTYRSALEDNERLVRGTFWSSPQPADADPITGLEVSIEQNLQRNNRIEIGDRMRFDIAGREVTATVTSVRSVEWDNVANGGFVFVFRPGPVERIPHSFVTFVLGLDDAAARAGFQRDLAAGFANVSAIDVREILRSVQDILANVTLAVTVVGAVMMTSGILILIGAVAMTKFQRVYDAAIFRTLGASTFRLASMTLLEYGLLGALAGTMGALGALALSFVVSRELFDIQWLAAPRVVLLGVAATAMLVAGVGLAASLDVLYRKPLRTLRSE